jgi:hypothetical protein
VHAVSHLEINDIRNHELLFKIVTTLTGLTSLTLAGYLHGSWRYWMGDEEDEEIGFKFLEHGQYLPEFASKDSLRFLDVADLQIYSEKCHGLFFDRVQDLSQLKRLRISSNQRLMEWELKRVLVLGADTVLTVSE